MLSFMPNIISSVVVFSSHSKDSSLMYGGHCKFYVISSAVLIPHLLLHIVFKSFVSFFLLKSIVV